MKQYRQHRFEAPPGATDILLIRHGESRAATPEEPFPLIDGQGDPELAPQGREQAIAVGEKLRSHPISAVYVTNLKRTHETAAPLCRHLNLQYRVEPALREVHLGEWEGGVFRIKAHENDPVFVRMQQEQRWDVIPGAESAFQVRERVQPALRRIASNHPDEMVAVVVHGGIVGHILAEATGSAPFAFNGCDNASISRIVVIEDRIIVRGFNDVSHLTDLQSASSALS